jgi:hypothetical protein
MNDDIIDYEEFLPGNEDNNSQIDQESEQEEESNYNKDEDENIKAFIKNSQISIILNDTIINNANQIIFTNIIDNTELISLIGSRALELENQFEPIIDIQDIHFDNLEKIDLKKLAEDEIKTGNIIYSLQRKYQKTYDLIFYSINLDQITKSYKNFKKIYNNVILYSDNIL